MSRIVYVNGQFVPETEAHVSVFDRGFLFGDGVYEVSAVLDRGLVDNAAHLARLERSLGELGMDSPATPEEIVRAQNELIARNDLDEGIVYLQITRGPADRDFAWPAEPKPTLVMFTQEKSLVDNPLAARGIKVITVPELRWQRRDVKTVGLLAASMAKQAALDAGADDAWMVEDGFVTEGSSNNACIVTDGGVVVTRHLGNEILHGITRAVVLRLSREHQIAVEERSFTVEEAKSAAEAFITSASAFVIPVIDIDGETIGAGVPGPITRRLREIYVDSARASAAGSDLGARAPGVGNAGA